MGIYILLIIHEIICNTTSISFCNKTLLTSGTVSFRNQHIEKQRNSSVFPQDTCIIHAQIRFEILKKIY